MKKVVVLSAVAAAVMMAGAANAAEIYNKDGNKLDLYGKVDGLHYFSSNHSTDGDLNLIMAYARHWRSCNPEPMMLMDWVRSTL